ncbi:MAG TPA: histidine kinase [Clostridiales bacterium]|nr:histidine kinase [Clostridiales bacterium]
MKKRGIESINKRFFKSMSLVTITFVLILFLASSSIFYRHIFSLESDSSTSQLNYISEQLGYFLESVDNYSKTIISDSRIQSYVRKYNSNRQKFDAVSQLNIKNEINHVIQSTPFVHSVSLYSTDLSLIVTTEIYPYPGGLGQVPVVEDEMWVPRLKYSKHSHRQKVHALSLIRPFYNYSTGALLGYMEIAIPEEAISAIYKDKSNSFSKLFIVDNTGTVQSSDGSIKLAESYRDFPGIIQFHQSGRKLGHSSIVLSQYIPALDWYIIYEINLYNFLKPTFTTFIISILIVFLCIIASLSLSHRVSKTITSPIYRLVSHTQKIKEGNWSPVQEAYSDSDIGLLFEEFNSMIAAQEKLKNDLLAAQKLKAQLSLDLLQQQVNPHFLYNSLDNICSLAEIDEKETLLDLVMNLSAFYRQGLSNGEFQITVREELEITKSYLNILKIRYFNLFDYHILCEETLLSCSCLKFLLQPVVENSIYHGIKELTGRKGYLEIRVQEAQERIIFTIYDNGIGIPPEKESQILNSENSHFGIKNIHQRIQLYYGSDYGLEIKNAPDIGCLVTITIKKQEVGSNVL